MAREVFVQTWCDAHLEIDDEQVPGEPVIVSISLNGQPPRPLRIDLCTDHHAELITPVGALLTSCGVPPVESEVRQRRGRGGSFHCALPGCPDNNGQGFSSGSSFGSHVRQFHDMSMGEYRRQTQVVPPNNDGSPRAFSPGEVFTCEVCGKSFSNDLGHNRPAQAWGLHRVKVHNLKAQGR